MRTLRSIHKKMYRHLLRRLNIMMTAILGIIIIVLSLFSGGVKASSSTTLRMVINPGNLSVGIVDIAFQSVANPSVVLKDVAYKNSCQTSRGSFGTDTQQIYIANPSAAHNGWTVTLSAENPSMTWSSGQYNLDFNDSTENGCLDGDDSDEFAGSLMIDPSNSKLTTGQCRSCMTNNIIPGNPSRFIEGKIDSVTILSGSPDASDIGDWVLTGINIEQTVPSSQPAAGEYTIPLSLSITAQ